MEECTHPLISLPNFDAEEAEYMTAEEVQKKFPRGHEQCSICGTMVITYASSLHYISGDW